MSRTECESSVYASHKRNFCPDSNAIYIKCEWNMLVIIDHAHYHASREPTSGFSGEWCTENIYSTMVVKNQ